MPKKTKPTASKPHPTSHTGRSFELVVRQIPYPKPASVEQREANRTPPTLDRRFRVNARTYDKAKKEAHRILTEEGFTVRSIQFAEANRIAAVVVPKVEKKGPQLPLSRLKR